MSYSGFWRDAKRFASALVENEDGGEGSGNFNHEGRPGQIGGSGPGGGKQAGEKAGLSERAKFIANMISPEEEVHEQGRERTSRSQVEKNNRERNEWYGLTLSQKIKGAEEQRKHMNKVKRAAYREAARGNLGKAAAIMKKYKHYWNNDPESEMKVQSETLARQKKADPGLL